MAIRKNLMIVTEVKNHLLMSILDYLKKESYQTTLINADIDAINGVKDNIGGILINADEKLLEQQPALYFIKDKVVMDNLPLFVLGIPEDLNVVKSIIPHDLIRKEFVRPLSTHVSNVIGTIDSFIRQNILQKKILVVDDSGPMLRTVKSWLESRYSIFLANSGVMAIKYLTLNRPDLILLDYEMPIADGKQVLEMIRAEADFSDIPVIFLTRRDDPESIMNVKELRPEGYLLKTLEPSQIVGAIDEFFEKRKALV